MTVHEETITDLIQQEGGGVKDALEVIYLFGQIEGDHHRAWVIDQVTRHLLGSQYDKWVEAMKADGEYSYDTGIAP